MDLAAGLADLPLLALLALAGIMLFAGLVHGTLGLGFPLVSTPLIALFLDVRTAILVTLVPTAAVNIASILRGGRWRESIGRHWPLAAFAVVGALIGTHVLTVSDPAPFKLLLAALIALYLVTSTLSGVRLRWVSARPALGMFAFGLAAGLAAGTTNVMVPLLIIYALEVGLERTRMVQVFNLCFLAGKLSQIGAFGWAGLLGVDLLLTTAPLAVLALIALGVGVRLRDRVPAAAYRRAVRGLLGVLAVLLVAQFLWRS